MAGTPTKKSIEAAKSIIYGAPNSNNMTTSFSNKNPILNLNNGKPQYNPMTSSNPINNNNNNENSYYPQFQDSGRDKRTGIFDMPNTDNRRVDMSSSSIGGYNKPAPPYPPVTNIFNTSSNSAMPPPGKGNATTTGSGATFSYSYSNTNSAYGQSPVTTTNNTTNDMRYERGVSAKQQPVIATNTYQTSQSRVLGSNTNPITTMEMNSAYKIPSSTTPGNSNLMANSDFSSKSTNYSSNASNLSYGNSHSFSTSSQKSNGNADNDAPYTTKMQRRGEPQGLVGLKNIGNTCFMNSILQCLFNTPKFYQYFVNGTHKKDLNPKHKDLALSFGSLLQKIHKQAGPPSSYNSESTYDLKRSLERVNSQFSGYDQQDAQEFLKALLEGINDDGNRNRSKPAYKELKVDPRKSIQDVSNEWFEYNLGRDNSIITDLFCGQLLNKVICTHCNYESVSFDNFWDLSLSFTRGLSMLESCDLGRMMEHFLKEELLEDLFYCEKCKDRRKSKKKFMIWKTPTILVIHLKRFHYGKYKREKIRHSVIFPIKDFNLKPFLEGTTDPSTRDCIYDLHAIVNHSGDLYGGHYTAECMNQYDKKWYNFNDDSVREVYNDMDRYARDGGASPYLLFYCKKSAFD
jgi:ubiquitin C-terminal hydrolase